MATASAQSAGCEAMVGVTTTTVRSGRDWDLSASGEGPVPRPSLSTRCTVGRFWMGVDATPGVQHRYRSLGGRAPFAVTTNAGMQLANFGPYGVATSWVFFNRSARGVGLGWSTLVTDRRVAVRAGVVPGPSPLFMTSLHVSPFKTADPFDDVALPVRVGFEVGGLAGLNVSTVVLRPRDREEGEEDGGIWGRSSLELGLRVGMLHRPRREIYTRPMVLATALWSGLDPELFLPIAQVSVGGMLEDGVVRPVVGVAMPLGGQNLRVHGGMLWVVDSKGLRGLSDLGVSVRW